MRRCRASSASRRRSRAGSRRGHNPVALRRVALKRVAALLVALSSAAGCIKQPYPPNRDVVSGVELENVHEGDEDDLEESLATRSSSRFFGLWEGIVFPYEILDERALAKDLERVERYYQRLGYYEAKVIAARVVHLDERHVRVEIEVTEGEPVRVARIDPSGLTRVPFETATEATRAIRLKLGAPFDETLYERSKRGIAEALADDGYAFAQVKGSAHVDVARHEARVGFDIEPGPLSHYGPISIEGLKEIPEDIVRKNLQIEPGERYSRAALREAQNALFSLGVFASARIDEDLNRPDTGTVPLTVRVQESLLRTVRLGGGVRLDPLRLAAHAIIGWEDRNLLGGLRQFEISWRPGVTFFPTSVNSLRPPTRPLFESSLRSSFRQPSFVEGRTTGRLGLEYNVFPLLFLPQEGVDPDDEVIIGYNQLRTAAGVERAFWDHRVFVAPSYNWQANFPFTYQGARPEGLDPVRVSFPELETRLDLRDDPIQPKNGLVLSNKLQVATRLFAGTVTDVRIRPEIRAFRELLGHRRLVLGTRLGFGMLFPQDYGHTLDPGSTEGQVLTRNPSDPDVIRDQHKLLFRAFYSGGPNSNRGYPFREVGPHGPVGFLIPTGANCSRETMTPDGEVITSTLDELEERGCIRPLGGLTLWEASVELRFRITGPLESVIFVDASDVSESLVDFRRFAVPHLSVGPGLRYQTPVGPLRLDIGYRVPGLQQEAGAADDGDAFLADREPRPLQIGSWSIPLTIHFAIGEAY